LQNAKYQPGVAERRSRQHPATDAAHKSQQNGTLPTIGLGLHLYHIAVK